jgi:hypothetical protein
MNAFYPTTWMPYLESREGASFITAMADVGTYLQENPQAPWASATGRDVGYTKGLHSNRGTDTATIKLTDVSYLGYAAIAAILTETGDWTWDYPATIHEFHIYASQRRLSEQRQSLPELPVPYEFKQVFRDWAKGKVNFTAPAQSR